MKVFFFLFFILALTFGAGLSYAQSIKPEMKPVPARVKHTGSFIENGEIILR